MDHTIANKIVDASIDMGVEEARLYNDYSGRGMFGNTTTAVVCSSYAMFCSYVAYVASEMVHEDNEDEIIEGMQNLKVGNMGCDLVFY